MFASTFHMQSSSSRKSFLLFLSKLTMQWCQRFDNYYSSAFCLFVQEKMISHFHIHLFSWLWCPLWARNGINCNIIIMISLICGCAWKNE
jgi:hypothetical protein